MADDDLEGATAAIVLAHQCTGSRRWRVVLRRYPLQLLRDMSPQRLGLPQRHLPIDRRFPFHGLIAKLHAKGSVDVQWREGGCIYPLL